MMKTYVKKSLSISICNTVMLLIIRLWWFLPFLIHVRSTIKKYTLICCWVSWGHSESSEPNPLTPSLQLHRCVSGSTVSRYASSLLSCCHCLWWTKCCWNLRLVCSPSNPGDTFTHKIWDTPFTSIVHTFVPLFFNGWQLSGCSAASKVSLGKWFSEGRKTMSTPLYSRYTLY